MTNQQKNAVYVKNYRNTRRATYLCQHGPCVKCGSWDRLEFDHIDPASKGSDKDASTHMWTWSEERLQAELKKCQILCYDCHKTKSIQQYAITFPQVHGTWQSYCRHTNPCKCTECLKAWREYTRPKWKAYKLRKLLAAKAA